MPLSMLLFIISIEPLSRKILSSSKIQGISLGKSNIKVSHYADDLTFFITSPHSFLPLREILDDFSNFSGLKINHSKTTIISNSPSLLSSFYFIFPQGKTLTSAKILGISFSFQTEDLEKNWDDLIRSIPHTILSSLNPNDSLFSRVISLNQHLLPKLLFLSRVLPPNPKQTRTLTSHLFEFLWNFSSFEPIKRSTLYLPKTDGGIFLPSIGARTLSAFLWQFIFLLKQETPISHFWMTYALYNIGSKIKPFNPTLYSNFQPHSPKPNFYWSQILKEISKINISPDAFKTLNFKSLYLLILNPDSNSIPSLPDPLNTKASPSSHTWPRLFLLKPHSSFFSNTAKEIAFRTAYKGYAWGCFFQKHLIPPL